MTQSLLRIATRNSPLAMWQAEHIKARLETLHPGLQVELLSMTTKGDRWLETSLSKVGGKGLFVKELETALLDGRADLAVHSMKDVPMEFPEGLSLGVICEREDPSDAFVSNNFERLSDMPQGTVVGTSSLRRESQLRHHYPHLEVKPVRGNVNTRLAKLDDGEFDAIILASAGLKRLGFAERIRHALEFATSLPAVGQGALGLELRTDDQKTLDLIKPLEHEISSRCVKAERALNSRLQGGCSVPVAAHAIIERPDHDNPDIAQEIYLRALVADVDGSLLLFAEESGLDPQALGHSVGEKLVAQGAEAILQRVNQANAE